jgi:cell division protein ZipA
MEQLDTQTLRWLLTAAGAAVIVAVYIWGRYKRKLLDFVQQRGEFDELDLDDPEPIDEEEMKPIKASSGFSANRDESPSPVIFDDMEDNEYFSLSDTPKTPVEPAPAEPRTAPLGAPFLIQISVVANEGDYFDGIELRDAMDDLRLIYGDMGIYHRYDRDYREPLFSIASLVEPGTFPIKDMENFDCPGVVLFFQPPQVDDPIAVFDDLVTTCHELAIRLGGVEWDEKRQPLTQEKIARMRSRLREAY